MRRSAASSLAPSTVLTVDLLPTAENTKKLARYYLKSKGFYSYDAAAVDEDPVSRWIGREVKRFLSEAHIHLPVLLQMAAAPPEVCAEAASAQDGAHAQHLLNACVWPDLLCASRR